MNEILILIGTGIVGLIAAFFGGRMSERQKQENKRHEYALKIVREAQKRSKKRNNDSIDTVKRRLRKNARDR